MKPEPMLMNYEKCDQVIFPLLQKKTEHPGPQPYYHITILPSHPFFKVAYPIDENIHLIVQIGNKKLKLSN